jgi:hypothetical protein
VRARTLLLAPVLVVAACGATKAPNAGPDARFSADLRAEDEQTRCDAFYALFDASGGESSEAPFAERTTTEVQAVLGDPNRVATLSHEGVEWLRIGYSFDTVYPSGAGEAGRRAHGTGWRYAPSLVFRDRVVVTYEQMARELGIWELSTIPVHLRFVPGGEFP